MREDQATAILEAMQAHIVENVTLDDIKASGAKMIYYAMHTCWWTHDPSDLSRIREVLGREDGGDLPCDPRGSVLMQTEDVEGFLRAAEENPSHYGKYGLRAFMAAHHANCFRYNSLTDHWSFGTWKVYNAVLDRQDMIKALRERV